MAARKKATPKKQAPARKATPRKAPTKAATKPAKTQAAAKAHAEGVVKRNQQLNAVTVSVIKKTAEGVHGAIGKHRKPDLAFPIRSLGNVSYSQKRGYFEIGATP